MNNSFVIALAVSGSDLYAGGDFTTAGGTTVNRIAKWNGSAWSALGTGMNASVYELVVSGSDLYAGGDFTTAGGVTANRIAEWNGSAWSALGTGMNAGVFALAVSGSDLYAGGDFTTADGVTANRIAKWNGSEWSALGTGVNSGIGALAVIGSRLYLGGGFTLAGTTVSPYIVQANLPAALDIAVAQVNPVADGSSVDFATVTAAGSSDAKIFTITNPGSADLTSLVVTKDGTDHADFSISALSTTSIPVGSGTATFTVTFAPTSGGTKTAALRIASNVIGTRNPYDITLNGTAYSFATDTDSDGLNDASEFQMAALGFDPAVSQATLVAALFNNANGAGLFTTPQVQALNVGTPLIQRNGAGQFTLTLGLEKSTTLAPGSFNPFPMSVPQISINGEGKLEFLFTVPDNAAFFRLQSQ
jgi:hypothetical protein